MGRIKVKVTPEQVEPYLMLGDEALHTLLGDVADGVVEPATAEAIVIKLLAGTIDQLIPTGPLDAFDDDAIEQAVAWAFDRIKDRLKTDADELRARIAQLTSSRDRAQGAGRSKRAGRIQKDIDRLTARLEALEALEADGEG